MINIQNKNFFFFFNAFDLAELPIIMNFMLLPQITGNIANFTLSKPQVQALMSKKFDAVIVEVFGFEVLFGN